MKRNFVRLAVLVTVILLLGAGLTQAAPTERATAVHPASSAPTPPAPPRGDAGRGPSSAPTLQPLTGARPTVTEAPPAALAAAAVGPTLAWNRVLSYVGNVLKPRENDVTYRISGAGEGCVYVASGNAAQVWNVPVTLPEGAQVQWLRMLYRDNSASTMYGWFTIYNGSGLIQQEWVIPSANGVATGLDYNYTDVAITPPHTIDYSTYSYVINWQPNGSGEDLQLCGFRLFYYQPLGAINYFPAVRR